MYEERPGYSEGYAPPPGGAPPGHGPHYESKTEKGVKYFYWMLLIQLIVVLLAFVMALAAYAIIASTDFTDESAVNNIVGTLVMIGTVACVILILAIVALIFLILGVVNFNAGKHEFPGKHPGSVTLGLIFFILWIVMFFIGFAAPFMFMGSYTGDPEDVWNNIRNTYLIAAVVGLLSSVFSGLVYVFMIKEIAMPEDKKLLWVGFLLLLISGIISVALTAIMLPADIGDLSSSDLQALSTGGDAISNMGSIASFIGIILYFIAYRRTLKAMQMGQIQPAGIPPGR